MPDANGNFKLSISVPELPWKRYEVLPDDLQDEDAAKVATKALHWLGERKDDPDA